MINTTLFHVNAADNAAIAHIDGPTNRQTIYSTSDGVITLTVKHQDSSENPGLDTQRSNVRFTRSKEIEDSGKLAYGYVQFTSSFPKTVFTLAEAQALVAALVNYLIAPATADSTTNCLDALDILATARLWAGES